MVSRVAVLLLMAAIYFNYAAAEIPTDCCLAVKDKSFNPKLISRLSFYKLQDAGKGCSIDACVFFTKAGRSLCTPHPSKSTWVSNVIAILNKIGIYHQ